MVNGETGAGTSGCLVLLCEGNPDPSWQKPFIQLCLKLRAECGEQAVTLAFLHDLEPSLLTVARQAASNGAGRLAILPMALSLDEAQEQEIPRQIVRARQLLPGLDMLLLPPLGEYPQVGAAIHAVTQGACGVQGIQCDVPPPPAHRFILLSTSPDKQKTDP